MANKINAHAFIECSAKTKENIQKVFEIAAKAAMSRKKKGSNQRFNCGIL